MYTGFPRASIEPPSQPPSPRPAQGSWLARHRPWLLAASALLLLFAWLSWKLPINRALEPLAEPTLVLLDREGRPFARRGAYKEAPVDARMLPPHVTGAVLAIEDRRFHSHGGIDLRGIGRAAIANAQASEIRQGGSTITQQLAKAAFLSNERTLRRKAQEALIALWLELRLDKHEILSRYLSAIYFGDGVYGLRAAARHYFAVEPEDLDIAQAAMLAGMIKAPSALAPTRHPGDARARARLVLDAMAETGVISEAQARATPPARVTGGRAELPVGSYFADWVSPQAKEAFDAAYGEVVVPTTLDSELQHEAERIVARMLDGEGRRAGARQAALVAMRPNGEVVAMVGGRDYAGSAFNRVTQAQRQPGSAFKLFVYRAALEDGATPESPVDDVPVTVGDWSPTNHGDHYRGRIPLREAFAHSSNAAAVRLAQQVGPEAVARAAREWGIRSPLGEDATIALGTYETNLLELTAAYAALAAGAAPLLPHGIAGHPADGEARPLDPRQRAMLLDLLFTAVDQGTGREARLRIPAFGKTGTSQDHRDALFVGMAGDLVAGVWVGNDDNTPMRGVTGGTLPARAWGEFMAFALNTQRAAGPPQRSSSQARSRAERGGGRWERLKNRIKGKWRGKGKGRKR
jgi:penicillin-binding protein 1A